MLEFNFNPFPELSTERFLLRRVTTADVQDIFAFRSDPQVMRFIPRPIAKTHEEVIQLIEKLDAGIASNQTINWAVCPKETNQLIGIVGYVRSNPEHHRVEIGYALNKDFHGQRVMGEVIPAILKYGFETMKVNAVDAIIDPENIPSVKLIESCGFKRDGRLREFTFHNNSFADAYSYSLLSREWNQKTL